jgi:hypothetical protein
MTTLLVLRKFRLNVAMIFVKCDDDVDAVACIKIAARILMRFVLMQTFPLKFDDSFAGIANEFGSSAAIAFSSLTSLYYFCVAAS